MKRIKLWYIRNFKIIPSTKEAEELGLKWSYNVYGDLINMVNCRSKWLDNRGNYYRVDELYKTESEKSSGRYLATYKGEPIRKFFIYDANYKRWAFDDDVSKVVNETELTNIEPEVQID